MTTPPHKFFLLLDRVIPFLCAGYLLGAVILGWFAGRDYVATYPLLSFGWLIGSIFWIIPPVLLLRIVVRVYTREGIPFRPGKIGVAILMPVVFFLGVWIQQYVQDYSRTSLIAGLPMEELREACLHLMKEREEAISSGRLHGSGFSAYHEQSPPDQLGALPDPIAHLYPQWVYVYPNSVSVLLKGGRVVGSDGLVFYKPGHDPQTEGDDPAHLTPIQEGVYRTRF